MDRGEAVSVKVRAPAKINLWLEIVGKRADGYHDLSSLMLPIGVYDDLELRLQGEGISMECSHPDVPADAGNLAWRAAESYFARVPGPRTGVHIRLTKNIPVGAGLGGGSADAGAVLLALDALSPSPLPPGELHGLASKLGADVPFFLIQRPCLATGIGEKLEAVDGLPNYSLLLIKPPVMVSTGWAYKNLKLTRGGSYIKIESLLRNPWDLQPHMVNDLETVTLAEYPMLARIKAWISGNGAVATLMSGSGPTVFGIFRDRGECERAGTLARKAWSDCWVGVTEVLGVSSSDR